MTNTVMLDVVAFVLSADAVHNAKAALQQRLERSGAQVVQRLGKEVTHVVFERRRSQRARDKAAEEAEISGLYRRLDAMEHPPMVVSPLWVEQSLGQKRRLIESKFTVARPKENILAPVATGSAGGKKRRQRSTAGKPPKPSEAFDIDDSDWMFSSSQQIHPDSGAEGGLPEAPSPRPQGKRSARQTRGKAAATKAAAGRQQELPQQAEQMLQVGSATQAVADILAIDLPGDAADEDDGDLDTPLGVRFARHSLGKRLQSAGEEKTGPAAAAPRRSRLAKASGPAAAKDDDGEEEEVDGEGLGSMQPSPPCQAQRPTAGGAPGNAPPFSSRFSVRQLQSHPDRPVAVHKGTPLPGAGPRPAAQQKFAGPIPVPVVDRVESPWAAAAALPLSQSGTQPEAPPGSSGAGKRAGSAGLSSARPGLGSRLGSVDKGHGTLLQAISGRKQLPSPWSAPRPWDQGSKGTSAKMATQAENQRGADGAAAEADVAGAVEVEVGAAEEGAIAPQHLAGGSRAVRNKRSRRGTASRDQGPVQHEAGGKRGKRGAAVELPGESSGGGWAAAVTQGFVSTTSCGSAVEELCRSAVRRLRGLRMCLDGHEDRAVTHLVIGSERRTLKAMLAVANGAWLVSPEWVTASLEAGRWLPESRFPANVRFVGAAQRARNLLDVPDATPLLGDFAIHVHAGRARQAAAAAAGALRRVAAALGAKSVTAPPKACNLCVVSGEGGCAEGLPQGVCAVREEWLWQAAERFEVPAVQDFLAS